MFNQHQLDRWSRRHTVASSLQDALLLHWYDEYGPANPYSPCGRPRAAIQACICHIDRLLRLAAGYSHSPCFRGGYRTVRDLARRLLLCDRRPMCSNNDALGDDSGLSSEE